MSRRTLLGLLVACVAAGSLAAGQEPPVAILGVPTEVKDIEAQLVHPTIERVQGAPFTVGTIGSRRVILGKTNAGKVNAAMMAALVINRYAPSAVSRHPPSKWKVRRWRRCAGSSASRSW
jgi:hypothetical protein